MTMLVSLVDMKAYLGISVSTYDTFLTEQITLISDSIEGYCGRKFISASYTQTFYAKDYDNDADYLYLYHYPVSAITSVTQSDGVTSEVLASTDYKTQKLLGRLERVEEYAYSSNFFSDYPIVQVVFVAGEASAPTPIRHVVFSLVEERYNKKINGAEINFGSDVQRISIPGTIAIDFDYSLQANERKNAYGMFIGNYANVLDSFRSERVLYGEIKESYVS